MIALLLATILACGEKPPATATPSKKAPAAQDDDAPGADDPDDPGEQPEGPAPGPLPRPTPVESEARVRALEAQVALLERQVTEGVRPDPWAQAGIINAHEHLYAARYLDGYLQAARRAGVAATVFVASPQFTLEGKGDKGEPGMSTNFEEILAAAKLAPDEVIPFCTLDPKDPDKLARLKRHVAEGARGLKLYSGHSNFMDGPLAPPDMEPVLSYAEETGLPVLWHINLSKVTDEVGQILDRHPKLNLVIPHYGVAFWGPRSPAMSQLQTLLRAHPNLYIDTSLGTREILLKGLATMEGDVNVFQVLFHDFPRQIIWGTDSVVTGNPEKTPRWFSLVLWASRDAMEREVFQTDLAAGYSRYYQKGRDGDGVFRGLALNDEELRLLYHDNALRWLHLEDHPPKPPVVAP